MKKEDSAMMKEDPTTMKKDANAMTATDHMMTAGSYVAFAPEKIATAAATGNVVLFFRASWCPTCHAVDADIKAHLTASPKNLTILDVDYDNSAALKQKYGVTYQHTFVQVDAKGTLIRKWSGSPTLEALVAQVK